MSSGVSQELTTKEDMRSRAGGLLRILRIVALIGLVVGAVGSIVLMLNSGRNAPLLLKVLFTIWVLSPFAALAGANWISRCWSVLLRATLYCLTIVITLISLAVYAKIIRPPAGSPNAFVFVAVPPGTWLVIGIVLTIAALLSRILSR